MEDYPIKEINHSPILPRSVFLTNALKATGALALMQLPGIGMAGLHTEFDNKMYTVGDIMDLILKEVPGVPFKNTVDTLKSGSRESIVTGIVTTMFVTVKVIEESAKRNANFIIAHEPTFYNHTDDINWVSNNSQAKRKQALLLENKITVWRFHDYWHACKPDGIQYGFMKKMNWLPFFKTREAPLVMPPTLLSELVAQLKTKLGIEKVRVIGDLSQTCSRIAVLPGAWGGQSQISMLEKEKPDVMIVGEVHEWETAEYIRDARLLGSKMALVVLGHSVSEEPGMEWLVDWLQPKLPAVPIEHIASGNPFIWV